MTTAPLLMPDLTLQFPLGLMCAHKLLALIPQRLSLLEHPRVSCSMLRRAHRAVSNVFREVLCVCKDLSLGYLREGGNRVESVATALRHVALFQSLHDLQLSDRLGET